MAVMLLFHGSIALSQPARSDSQRVFTLQHRQPGDVLPQIKHLVGANDAEVFLVPERGQIVVRGTPSTLALAAQIVQQLDQPPAGGPPQLRSYNVPPEKQTAAQNWQEQFQGLPGERAAWDSRTGQLIVLASPQRHAEINHLLANAESQEKAALRLRSLTPEQLHGRLQTLTGKPLPATWDSSRRWLSFPVRFGGAGVGVKVDSTTRDVYFTGSHEQTEAWKRAVAAMDSVPQAQQTTELVASEEARSPAMRRALNAIARTTDGQGAFAQLAATQVTQPVDPEEDGPDLDAEPESPELTAEQKRAIAEEAVRQAQQAGSLIGPVQVEFIEGLDIIILRGNEQDVQRVMQIINQIERLSEVTVPAIEVYELSHVDAESMARLLNRVYQQVLGARTGSVSVTNLGRPNELLLIGRPENVRMAIDLIKQLDKPADPTSQFVVFRLKNAAAADAKELLDQFLASEQQQGQAQATEEQPLLPSKAIVVADVRSNSLIVRAAPRDMREVNALLERIDTADTDAVDEVRVFALRNARADDLAEVLTQAVTGAPAGDGEAEGRRAGLRMVTIDAETQRRLDSGVLTEVRIAANIRANTLIVTAPTRSMDLIAALINQLDQPPQAEAELKVFTIKNGDAEALVAMLRGLFGTEDEDDAEAGGLSNSSNSLIRLQFSVDARTNSIIAAGTTEDLLVVEAILLRLDGADDRDRRIEVYRLKNAPAEQVAEAINQWLDEKREAEEAADLTVSPFEQIDREVIVVPELVSNTIIINATEEYIGEVRRLIEKLDERPPMVMIQVLIAEVALNDTDEFGVELGLQDSLLFDRSIVGDLNTVTNTTQTTTGGGAVISTVTQQNIVNAPLQPGFNFNDTRNPLGNNGSTSALQNAGKVAAQGLSNFAVGRINSDLDFGGFVFSASSSSVSMLLRALQENRRLEVLSRPQIMALDNQLGRVSVGARVPTVQGVEFNEFGQQQNQISYEDVGITLEVTPRISPDNQVVMDVYAEKSQLGPEAEGIPIFAAPGGTVIRAPVINQTVADTVVTASSGQTVVLSGLLTKQTSDIHRRVPLLSDIPLLGDLFRYDSVAESRTEMLIILTPRIVRSELDADMLKQIESARMSWVMCDVVHMHGPSGIRSRCDDWGACNAPPIYPTYVPAENEFSPAPAKIEYAPPAPTDGPVQPEMWDTGVRTGKPDENFTPAGFTPGGGPGVVTPAAAESNARILPPVH